MSADASPEPVNLKPPSGWLAVNACPPSACMTASDSFVSAIAAPDAISALVMVAALICRPPSICVVAMLISP